MLVSDVAFLSRDAALLLFNREEGHETSIAIYSFQVQGIIVECRFPFSDIALQASFLTRPDSRFGDKCPSSIAKSLLPDPEVNILAMTFQLEDNAQHACCVLSVKRFTQLCGSLLKKYPVREVFDWEEWGPTVTRWLPYQGIMATGNRNIFGSRMVAVGPPGLLHEESHANSCLMLLDFNPRPIKRGAKTSFNGDSHEIVIDQETTWNYPHNGTVIRSSLPYRAFATSWYPHCSSFKFDGSTIIGRGVSSSTFVSIVPLLTLYPS
jgi:hypothetical protein